MLNNLFVKRALTVEEQQMLSAGRKKRSLASVLLPYLLILPTLAFMGIFVFFPLVRLIWLSLRKYNLISVDRYIGLQNYRMLFFVNKDFGISLRNTGIYTLASVALLILFAVLFGLSLQREHKLNAIVKRAIFFPHIVAGVSISMIFAWLMNANTGLFNQALQMLGLPTLKWLDSSATALACVIGINLWKGVGYYTLIVLAALGGIPTEINEAAALDNTPPLRKFARITFPMLSPQLFFMLVTITIGSFKVFDSVRLLTNGGPGTSTNVLVLYIYRYAFEWSLQIGYACAAGVILMLILLVLTVLYFKLLEKRVHYQ